MAVIDDLPPPARTLLLRLCRDGRDPLTGDLLCLVVDLLPAALGMSAIDLREAGDYLVEAGLVRWVDPVAPRAGPFAHRRIAATVEGESTVEQRISPADIRRQVAAIGTNAAISGSTFINSAVQVGQGNVASIATGRAEARPDVEVRLQLGAIGVPGGDLVDIVIVTATNAGTMPVVVQNIRWSTRGGESVMFLRDDLMVLNAAHPLPPGDDYSMSFRWPTFCAFLQNDLVAVAVHTKVHGIFRSDPDEFQRVVDHVLRLSPSRRS